MEASKTWIQSQVSKYPFLLLHTKPQDKSNHKSVCACLLPQLSLINLFTWWLPQKNPPPQHLFCTMPRLKPFTWWPTLISHPLDTAVWGHGLMLWCLCLYVRTVWCPLLGNRFICGCDFRWSMRRIVLCLYWPSTLLPSFYPVSTSICCPILVLHGHSFVATVCGLDVPLAAAGWFLEKLWAQDSPLSHMTVCMEQSLVLLPKTTMIPQSQSHTQTSPQTNNWIWQELRRRLWPWHHPMWL